MISIVDLGVVPDVRVDGERVRGGLHADLHGLSGARDDAHADGGARSARSARSRRSASCSTTRGRPTGSRPRAARSCATPASRRPLRAAPGRRRWSSSSAARSAARGAARPTRSSRTSSAPPRAARSATATLPPAVRAVQDDLMATTGLRAANQPPPLAGYDLFSENRPLVEALRREGGAPRRSAARRSGGSAAGSRSSWGGSRTSTRRSCARTTASASGSTRSSSIPAWHELLGLGVEHGLHALPWREPSGPRRARGAVHDARVRARRASAARSR